MARTSIRARLGDPPLDDTLAVVNWAQRLLAVQLVEVLDDKHLTKAKKRDETLRIVDRMAKLRDPDRIYQAEKAMRGTEHAIAEVRPGPKTQDAPDISQQPGPIAARRGRPPRSSLR